jgi:hypothetical protein
MSGATQLGSTASPAVGNHIGGHAGRSGYRRAGPEFHQVLAAAMTRSHSPAAPGAAAAGGTVLRTAAFHVPLAAPRATPAEQSAAAILAHSGAAPQQAMRLEGVPESWQEGLRFITAKESSGKVDARNPVHSARGLFQLTAANYHLNPHGAASFGNAVEEAQGGIRYIQQRYGTADNAVAFWQQHRWY